MVTPVTVQDKLQEDGDLVYAGEYLDIVETSKSDYTKRRGGEEETQTTYLSSLQFEI